MHKKFKFKFKKCIPSVLARLAAEEFLLSTWTPRNTKLKEINFVRRTENPNHGFVAVIWGNPQCKKERGWEERRSSINWTKWKMITWDISAARYLIRIRVPGECNLPYNRNDGGVRDSRQRYCEGFSARTVSRYYVLDCGSRYDGRSR